jgi:hypothetical protein
MADHDGDQLDHEKVAELLAALAADRLGYDPSRVRVEVFVEPADDGVHCWIFMQFSIDGGDNPSDHERYIVEKLLQEFGVGGMPVAGRA